MLAPHRGAVCVQAPGVASHSEALGHRPPRLLIALLRAGWTRRGEWASCRLVRLPSRLPLLPLRLCLPLRLENDRGPRPIVPTSL